MCLPDSKVCQYLFESSSNPSEWDGLIGHWGVVCFMGFLLLLFLFFVFSREERFFYLMWKLSHWLSSFLGLTKKRGRAEIK